MKDFPFPGFMSQEKRTSPEVANIVSYSRWPQVVNAAASIKNGLSYEFRNDTSTNLSHTSVSTNNTLGNVQVNMRQIEKAQKVTPNFMNAAAYKDQQHADNVSKLTEQAKQVAQSAAETAANPNLNPNPSIQQGGSHEFTLPK